MPLYLFLTCFSFIFIFFNYTQNKGYSPHPNYGMVVPPDYSSNSYSSYGSVMAAAAAAAYQCGATNSTNSSVNPYTNVGYQSHGVSGGSMSAANCYAMPPPQHLPQHDKNGSKDR